MQEKEIDDFFFFFLLLGKAKEKIVLTVEDPQDIYTMLTKFSEHSGLEGKKCVC